MIRRLNSRVRIIRTSYGKVPLNEIIATGSFDFQEAEKTPGWLQVLRGEEIPETDGLFHVPGSCEV